MKEIQIPESYDVISDEFIEDVHARGVLLRHRKSGARVALLANDDNNKVFNIAFRTPPKNSTGVAHIIEHTVLCGSRKFPLKDPFVELVKGSLNTFLNAMTYPDKTMFPVASCNDQDFQNLMDVYLDAVFYPNIYSNEKIFRQEGWHYQMETEDAPITYNGVVYNEMKGAFSSETDVLDRAVFCALFPDTPYGVESGGDPADIPNLTYEEFLDFHRKYYHPSNSYIYLYGDMDMHEKLDWLDREYLSAFDVCEVDSEIPMQKPFSEPKDLTEEYPVLTEEDTKENTYLSVNTVVGDYSDLTLNTAFSILEYVLLDAPGAPVKQALLDAGIGKDIDGSYEDGIMQPVFSITAKNAEASDKDRFLAIIRETLEKLAEEGIDRKAIMSGLNYFEFRFREADFGAHPKGLIYGIDLFDSWLYDENRPFVYLKELEVFEKLRKLSGEGYFEELIRKYLLNNPHEVVMTLVPKSGLAAARDKEVEDKLAAYKASLSEEEISRIVRETRELKEYQEEKESEEALAKLPMLKRSDIQRKTPIVLHNEELDVDGTPFIRHDFFTNGIGYLTVAFDTKNVPDELVSYIGILKGVTGYVSTEHYTYGELFHEVNANTGGISYGVQILPLEKGLTGKGICCFSIRSKYLYDKRDFVIDIIREVLKTSKLEDTRRLREIIRSAKAGLQHSIPAAGHASAQRRAFSYQSKLAAWQEAVVGIRFLHLLEDLDRNFDEKKDDLVEKLRRLMHIIFRPENMIVSLIADEKGFEGAEDSIRKLKADLYTDEVETGEFHWEPEQKNEGFKTPGQVQYVALAGNFRAAGYEYTGAFQILQKILSYDYLWQNIRVLGGAYGCMGNFQPSGNAVLSSYRDPHLKRTLEIYRKLPEYLREFDADEREMTKYIIGTISDLDTPMNASTKGSVSFNCWSSGKTCEDFQKEREQILDAQPADIRALADPAEAVIKVNNLCVIGSETMLEKDGDELKSIQPLLHN
ncbi:MAG: insulinase family protein [Eubacterium sp.]|nr:insulinase family protein [Eubacterium sp.]